MRSPVISLSSQQLCPPFVGVGYNPWSMFRFLVLFPLLPVVGLDYGLSCLNQFCVGICQSLETVCFGTKVTFKKKFGFLCVCVCVCVLACQPAFVRACVYSSLSVSSFLLLYDLPYVGINRLRYRFALVRKFATIQNFSLVLMI